MRIFIDLTNDIGTIVDEEGQDFATAEDARLEALRVLTGVAFDEYGDSDFLALAVTVRTRSEVIYEGKLSLSGKWVRDRA